ncbi:MAG: dihydroxy-acid dehydratase [Myxococcota bacterium]
MSDDQNQPLNKISRHITQPKAQGASQAMLYATGMTEEDMNKAQVGISSVWYEGNSCNMHLLDLATKVKEGVEAADLIGFRFNTIGVSDGMSMGTRGMSYSLQSRDLIADSVETVMGAQWYDANISLPGCDKNMPGVIMGMCRVNRPSLMIYGGTIKPGCSTKGEPLDIVSAFESYGKFLAEEITEEERFDIVRNACPGAGACGGMYTANTMAAAIEAMGMSLPYSSSTPATDEKKLEECVAAGVAIRRMLELDLKPSDIITRASLRNAMVVLTVLGGSTNAVLHLIAIARSIGIELSIDDFQDVSNVTPFLADMKPSGAFVMDHLHQAGGTPALIKWLLELGQIEGDCMTVTGKTLAENVADLPGLDPDQKVLRPWNDPIKPTGHITILRGSLAPDGAVAKITGKEGLEFSGPAQVFEREESFVAAMERGEINKGSVIVIRYEGPKGGPGMPEMLTPTSMIMGAGMGQDVAFITDGRFSGGSHGFIMGHVTPEAQEGGPIALVENGDTISIDAKALTLELEVPEDELAARRAKWQAPPLEAKRGTLYKYIKNVKSASEGCVTDE